MAVVITWKPSCAENPLCVCEAKMKFMCGQTPMQGSFKTMEANNSLGWGTVQHQIPRRRGSLRQSYTTALGPWFVRCQSSASWMETYHERMLRHKPVYFGMTEKSEVTVRNTV